ATPHPTNKNKTMNHKPSELAQRINAAGTVLSHMYLAAPTEELRAALYSKEMLSDWPLRDADSKQGVFTLQKSKPETAEELKRDHLYLFKGIGKPLAEPHESPYLSREGLVFDEQTFQVREYYRRYGFQAPNFNREPDDHIGLEIAFIANLADRYSREVESDEGAAEQTLGDIRTFLDEHLNQFAPDVIERIRKNANTAAYKALAEFTLGFLSAAEELTEELTK
ncbi:MAG: molecular chaperone TorD family protein, partial [Actinomycetaceae bacterium]|nr:molecular chaperone TorD family protein [Actinomycetaceae bacterium]